MNQDKGTEAIGINESRRQTQRQQLSFSGAKAFLSRIIIIHVPMSAKGEQRDATIGFELPAHAHPIRVGHGLGGWTVDWDSASVDSIIQQD